MSDIVKLDPARNLFTFPRWMDDFDDTYTQKGFRVYETDTNIVIEAVVAGVPGDDIDVNIEDGVVTIKAERKVKEKDKGLIKASYHSYYYTAALSGGKWDSAVAEVEHGVLTLEIPKQESARPQKIIVKTKSK